MRLSLHPDLPYARRPVASTKKRKGNHQPAKDVSPSKRVSENKASSSLKESASTAVMDRRDLRDRRGVSERRKQDMPVQIERRKLQRRVKVSRRRQIDPTTCERDYSADEVEFMTALDAYKRTSGRMFPTCSEILEVVRTLGYVKRPQSEPTVEPSPDPDNGPPATPHVRGEI